ncbi:PREDICTED: glutathione S-transferase 1-1-like isoform X2 [Papilio polytes]|uniref:glutathione S-transferase 1-1-like isoform X2 n=1 Tax=Papilio polytes TaxID=76194 RepID=UPI000675EC0B|nr:PREDICTED: glutathione S-transferase 1-1-like isoform X2 [Papilio polytes]
MKASLTIGDKLILYGDEASPPVRFVQMTASILGIVLDFRTVDLFSGENKTEFYKNINPLQKVPCLMTHDEVLADSQAIGLYLCRRWDTEHVLYPPGDLEQARCDEILFYNATTLFPIDSDIYTKFFAGIPASKERIEDWLKALDFLENRLKDHTWLAGDRMMLADICAVATISTMLCLIPLADHHVKLRHWFNEIEQQPFFNINKRGLERLTKFITAVRVGRFQPGINLDQN